MCGFRPSASTLATWLSSYYFSASYREEEGQQKSSILTPRVVVTALRVIIKSTLLQKLRVELSKSDLTTLIMYSG